MGSWSRREKEGRLRDPTRPQVADEKVEPRSTATFVGGRDEVLHFRQLRQGQVRGEREKASQGQLSLSNL